MSDKQLCATCGAEVFPDDSFCGACGAPVTAVTPLPKPAQRLPRRGIMIGAAIAVVALAAVVGIALSVSALAPPTTAQSDVAVPPAEAATSTPSPSSIVALPVLAGTWTGQILGDTSDYSVRVTITDDGTSATATAAYPEVPCSASWAQVSRAGSAITFVERVPADSICYDQVPLTVTLIDANTLGYTALSNGLTITSTLTRIG